MARDTHVSPDSSAEESSRDEQGIAILAVEVGAVGVMALSHPDLAGPTGLQGRNRKSSQTKN